MIPIGLIVLAPTLNGADCFVNFKGTTYDKAVELEKKLIERGYDATLKGQPGGPNRTPVVSIDGGFMDGASELEREAREALKEIGGGGKIQSCDTAGFGD